MDWINLTSLMIAGIVGYLFAISRDRASAIRSKKIEAITSLHERVLEIERRELSDGKSTTMAVNIHGGTKELRDLMADEEVGYLFRLNEWRQDLLEEEDRAGLWVDGRTVRIVRSYFLLMMHCKSWEKFGKGNLIEDPHFLSNLRSVFGRPNGVLEKAVIRHSKTGEPRLLDVILLSDMCLKVIQRRVRLEVSAPLRYFVMSIMWRLLDWGRDFRISDERESD